MVRIYLVRHGQSVANEQKIFTGQMDVELTEKGREQAKAVCDLIFNNYKVDKIYSSDLKRAKDTIRPLAEKLGLEITAYKEFREICAGDYQGVSMAVAKAELDYANWWATEDTVLPPNGETIRQLWNRSVNKFCGLVAENEGKNIVIASHNGVIRALIGFCKNYDASTYRQAITSVANCSVTEIVYENGVYTVVS